MCRSLILALVPCLCLALQRDQERASAVVTCSDGAAMRGELRIMGNRPLTIAPTGAKRQRTFRFADIVELRHVPEQATMERPWTFKESGKHEKIYLEGEYPLINFVTTVRLIDGSEVTGHIISAVLLLYTDGGKERIFLKRQIKGEIGATLEQLVYPRHIRFPEHEVVGGKRLAGRLAGWGELQDVRAIDLEREQVLVARVDGERFDFGNVLPGRYDLCALTPTHVLVGLSDRVPATVPAGEPLVAGDLEALREVFPKADDFFSQRWLLRANGVRNFAKTLVYKRREKYYDSERLTPGGFLWHLEVWTWHLADDEWKLDQRHILVRRRQTAGEQNRKLLALPDLGAVAAGSEPVIERADEQAAGQAVRDLD